MRDRWLNGRRHRFVRRAALIVAVLSVAVITAPATLAGAAKRVAPPPTIVSASTTAAVTLPAPGLVVVQSVALSKGTWTLLAKATAIDTGSPDFFRCNLVDITHSTTLDGATAFLNTGIPLDVITNLAVITAKGTVTISQECGHDSDAGDSGSIDSGASLVGFASQRSRVRIARSATQVNLAPSPIGIENLSLTKGTWVIAAKVTLVALSVGHAAGQCSYDPDQFERLLGTNSGDHAASTMFKVGATVTLTATTTFTLSCAATGGIYVDPGAVFWAWKANHLATADASQCPVTLAAAATTDALVLHQRNCAIGPGSFPSQMVGAHLRAGAWVGFSGMDNLDSQGTNVVRCQVLDAIHGKQLDVSSTAESPIANFVQPFTGITNLAIVDVKKSLDVEGRCGEDNAGPAAASDDSAWAFIKP